ncbi:hypothetical protein CSA37_03665 [Candidatus Fermentibacteria bacterium]|nr:MAG: hypothetical protein CSA37_03665 [Candidatus Fermentibacteria bacterium]
MQSPENLSQLFRQIIGALPSAYISGDVLVNGRGDAVDYSVQEVNHAFTELTGLTMEKVRGKRINGLFSIASTVEDTEIFTRVALTGEPVEKEFFSPAFGMYFKLLCFSQARGSFTALLSDQTSSKQCQERCKFLDSMLNSSSDEIYVLDSKGKFIMGNRKVAAKLGISRRRISSKHISDLNPVADQEQWSILWNSLVKKGSLQFETEHQNSKGEIYPVEISADLMENDREICAVMVAKNISGKRALGLAMVKEKKTAGKAADSAGVMLWLLDSSGNFRPLLGGGEKFVSGSSEEVFISCFHQDDRRRICCEMNRNSEGFLDARMRTDRGFLYHRVVWTMVDDDSTAGICYPLPGTGLAGSGSQSAVMQGYRMMTEVFFRKVQKAREALETDRPQVALRTLRSFASEFSLLTGQTAFPERVRFDCFLQENRGIFRHLLEPDILLEVNTEVHATGLIDPTCLENIMARLLIVVSNTGLVRKVLIKTAVLGRNSVIRIVLDGLEGIQSELDRHFIPVQEEDPGLASVYAMVNSAWGKVSCETRDSTVIFDFSFECAMMSDEEAAILIALPGFADSARLYAALRSAGFSAAIETSAEEIRRRFLGRNRGILIASDALAEFSLKELSCDLSGITIIQAGGARAESDLLHLPDGFRTIDAVQMVSNLLAKAEKPQEEDLPGGILWKESRQTPPL